VAVPEQSWKVLVENFGGGPSIPKFCVHTPNGVVFEEQIKITVEDRRGVATVAHIRAPKSMKYSKFRDVALAEVGLAEVAEDYVLSSTSCGQEQNLDEAAKESEEATLDSLGCVVRDLREMLSERARMRH
jgi:hypothetical protein